MISFIQNFLGKHHKWLFSGLLVIIIIAFVLTIGNTGGIGPGTPSDRVRDFYGVNLNSERDTLQLLDAIQITADLQEQNLNRSQLEEAALSRALLLHLANTYQIPAPTEMQLAQLIRQQRKFMAPDGRFSPDRYTQYVDSLQNNPRINEAYVSDVLSNTYRIEQVQELLAGPGYVLPQEARNELARRQAVWSLAVASLSFDQFQPEIAVEDEALQAYFAERSSQYSQPAQWHVDYIHFPRASFSDAGQTPSEAELQAWYANNRIHFVDTDGTIPEFTAVQEEVTRRFLDQRAQRQALNAAEDFSYTLFDRRITRDSAPFEQLLAQQELTIASLPVFSQQSLPDHPLISPQHLAEAFTLDASRYFTDAIATEDGAIVLLLNSVEPEREQELAAVREQVLANYIEEARIEAFIAKGDELRAQLQAALEQGESFAAAASDLELQVQVYEEFTRATPPAGIEQFILMNLEQQREGEVSPMLTLGERGYITCVIDKTIPELSLDNPEVLQTQQQLAFFTSYSTMQGVLGELIGKRLQQLE